MALIAANPIGIGVLDGAPILAAVKGSECFGREPGLGSYQIAFGATPQPEWQISSGKCNGLRQDEIRVARSAESANHALGALSGARFSGHVFVFGFHALGLGFAGMSRPKPRAHSSRFGT